MQILPAIDLSGGQVVRLFQGDYDKMTVYSADPPAIAQGFVAAGATNLHVVDLDGAKSGALENFDTIKALCAVPGLAIEVGGGIRTQERIRSYLDLGVTRVILGTVAVQNFDFVAEMAAKYGDAIAVGVDAKDGFVATHGWLQVSAIEGIEFCRRLAGAGVKTVIYTDISRDGAEAGSNLALYEQLSHIDGLNIIASGGVSDYSELVTLKKMGVWGAILGKALYTGRMDLKQAVAIAKGENT